MPRITEVTDAAAPSDIIALFGQAQAAMGMVPNVFRAMANSPAVLRSFMTMQQELGGGALDRQLQQKIAVLVAQFDRSPYCLAVNTAVGTMVGASEAELRAARAKTSEDPRTAAALAFTAAVLENRAAIGDDDVDALRQVGFSEAEIAEIAAAIGFNLFANYFNLIADTVPDFPAVSLDLSATDTSAAAQ